MPVPIFRVTVGLVVLLATTTIASSQTIRTTGEVVVRLYPDQLSPEIATVLAGSLLDLVAVLDDWYSVLLPPSDRGIPRRGYISRRLAEVLPPAERNLASVPPGTIPGKVDGGSSEEVAASQPHSDSGPTVKEPTVKEGPYVAVTIPYSRFQDQSLANGYGIGISIGRRTLRRSVDFSYLRSLHAFSGQRFVSQRGRDTRVSFQSTAVYHRLGVDTKRYWLSDQLAQPFLHVAFGVPWLTVREAFVVNGTVGDLSFVGLGIDIGGGVAIFSHPRIAMQISVLHRVDFFLGVHTGEWTQLDDPIIERGPKVATTLTLAF